MFLLLSRVVVTFLAKSQYKNLEEERDKSAEEETLFMYEVVSKILRTGVAIHTAVMVARSTVPNRPNCEFRVLLRLLRRLSEDVAPNFGEHRPDCFTMTTPRPRLTRPHPAVSDEIQNGCHSPPTVIP
jgi:hypothetical protein